jgi:putative alpha-1,2-mannosidase
MKTPIKKILPALIIVLLARSEAKSQQSTSYTKYVNTFVGTAPLTDSAILGYNLPRGWRSWAGLTFPGSSLPNAMVQLSPITEFGSGA